MAVLATLVRRTRPCAGEILSTGPNILLDRTLASSGTSSFDEPQQCWHQRDAHHSTTLGMHDFRSRPDLSPITVVSMQHQNVSLSAGTL
jgi:hypothetical protein